MAHGGTATLVVFLERFWADPFTEQIEQSTHDADCRTHHVTTGTNNSAMNTSNPDSE